jgi:3-methyl-2-oxobutanoate hydroxymethyltransferase
MVHHCLAVTRGVQSALVVGDLPFGSYEVSIEQGVHNAVRLVKEGGVAVVKLEGPESMLIATLTTKGIPVMGHLGVTPQSVHATSSYKVQARIEEAVARLIGEARCLEAAGACAVVLEAIPTGAARLVTEALTIPTIGIGAGPHCDGQVLVSTEMLGLSSGPPTPVCQALRQPALRGRSCGTRVCSRSSRGPLPQLRTFLRLGHSLSCPRPATRVGTCFRATGPCTKGGL